MPDPRGVWAGMGAFLRSLPARLPEPPKAILIVSAHWETEGFRLTAGGAPLIYDYYGFPAETYDIAYDPPVAAQVAFQAARLLRDAELQVEIEAGRGFDHGVFVPLKVAFPEADIPVIEMSVERGMDPGLHLVAGAALTELRDDGVLIVGSGMSFHDLKGFGDQRSTEPSRTFDLWLTDALAQPDGERWRRLMNWASAPEGRASHPTAEHLIPLMVAAGAGEGPGQKVYSELVLETEVSGFRFA